MRIARVAGDDAARAVLGHKHATQTEKYGALDIPLACDAARKAG
jgi:hypothetical protein